MRLALSLLLLRMETVQMHKQSWPLVWSYAKTEGCSIKTLSSKTVAGRRATTAMPSVSRTKCSAFWDGTTSLRNWLISVLPLAWKVWSTTTHLKCKPKLKRKWPVKNAVLLLITWMICFKKLTLCLCTLMQQMKRIRVSLTNTFWSKWDLSHCYLILREPLWSTMMN